MDTQKEKQRLEKLKAVLEMIEYADIKIKTYEDIVQRFGMFGTTSRSYQENEITKKAKQRLIKYYESI